MADRRDTPHTRFWLGAMLERSAGIIRGHTSWTTWADIERCARAMVKEFDQIAEGSGGFVATWGDGDTAADRVRASVRIGDPERDPEETIEYPCPGCDREAHLIHEDNGSITFGSRCVSEGDSLMVLCATCYRRNGWSYEVVLLGDRFVPRLERAVATKPKPECVKGDVFVVEE